MPFLTFQAILDMNQQLAPHGFQLKLQDSCGGQIVSIRTLSGEKAEVPSTVSAIIEEFLQTQRITPSYNEAKTSFLVTR